MEYLYGRSIYGRYTMVSIFIVESEWEEERGGGVKELSKKRLFIFIHTPTYIQ